MPQDIVPIVSLLISMLFWTMELMRVTCDFCGSKPKKNRQDREDWALNVGAPVDLGKWSAKETQHSGRGKNIMESCTDFSLNIIVWYGSKKDCFFMIYYLQYRILTILATMFSMHINHWKPVYRTFNPSYVWHTLSRHKYVAWAGTDLMWISGKCVECHYCRSELHRKLHPKSGLEPAWVRV